MELQNYLGLKRDKNRRSETFALLSDIYWSAGADQSAVINKTSVTEVNLLGNSYRQRTEEGRLHLMSNLLMCESVPRGSGREKKIASGNARTTKGSTRYGMEAA